MGSIRVLIVDDDERYAHSLEALLEADGRFEVVGWASNGAEAVSLVQSRRPDLVTMDLRMPVVGGVEATRAICESFPGTPIVVLSGSPADDCADAALEAGAVAHVTKADVDAIVPALADAVSSSVGR